jgi:hypothetical protein
MAHSKEAHSKMNAMAQFNEGHHEKKYSELEVADGKYCTGEMENPEHLANSVKGLANYAKKHKMSYP